MFEIIPAILTKKKNEFNTRLKLASKLANTVQIDIMDGLFVDNETPKKLNDGTWYKQYLHDFHNPTCDIELHLMVINPLEFIDNWKELYGINRIIWHEEVPINHEELIRYLHDMGIKACLAINPQTDIKRLYPYIEKEPKKKGAQKYFLDSVMVMGVKPGFSGQKFIPDTLKTIAKLHKKYPHLPIAVDGGVNQNTAKDIKKAGASRLCAAGAIFLADDPKKAYNNLRN